MIIILKLKCIYQYFSYNIIIYSILFNVYRKRCFPKSKINIKTCSRNDYYCMLVLLFSLFLFEQFLVTSRRCLVRQPTTFCHSAPEILYIKTTFPNKSPVNILLWNLYDYYSAKTYIQFKAHVILSKFFHYS